MCFLRGWKPNQTTGPQFPQNFNGIQIHHRALSNCVAEVTTKQDRLAVGQSGGWPPFVLYFFGGKPESIVGLEVCVYHPKWYMCLLRNLNP